MSQTGEAFAFFDLEAAIERLRSELPDIKLYEKLHKPGSDQMYIASRRTIGELVTQEGISIDLWAVGDYLKAPDSDPDLVELARRESIYSTFPSELKGQMAEAQPILMSDLKYVMRLRIPEGSIEQAGNHLNNVLNSLHLSYQQGKIFNVAVVGKVEGEYTFWED